MEVSRSGYYDWKTRPESATAKRRELLKVRIKALFEANSEEYGYRRVHRALARSGEECSPELVRRLMRELGLEPCQPRPYRHSLTEQDGGATPVPDLVNRDFTAERPGQKMVGGITCIPTWEGWVFLSVTWNHHGVASREHRGRPIASPQADGGGGPAGDGCGAVWQVAGSGTARAGC
jgi:transposase InsO family protein